MVTLLITLSTGEAFRSTDPHSNFEGDTDDAVFTMVGQTIVMAQEDGLSFLLFPDDRTGKNRLLNLFSIVSVDVVRESAAVSAVRASEDVRPAETAGDSL